MFPSTSSLSLLFLALFVPTTLTQPSKRQSTNCSPKCGRTRDWSWRLTDFYFHSSVIFSTPAHQIDGGWVSFNLTHPAINVTMECSASSTQLQDWFYGNQWYACNGGEGGDGTVPGNATASFRFERVTGRVDVNQTWGCGDGSSSVIYNASGSGNATLSCNRTTWQNANWTMGQIYSTDTVECAKTNFTIRPTVIEHDNVNP